MIFVHGFRNDLIYSNFKLLIFFALNITKVHYIDYLLRILQGKFSQNLTFWNLSSENYFWIEEILCKKLFLTG